MLKIGLTGGIGSGKSTVSEIFKIVGIPIFDADTAAKIVMEKDEELIFSIQKVFGEESYTNKKLNRQFIASIVFSDRQKLEQLNALVHPATIAVAEKWVGEQKAPYVIKEAALLFEANSNENLDYVIGVSAPSELRIQRVMERDDITKEQVFARMDRQMNEEQKMKLCDYVIINNEHQLLIPQVLQLHEKFLSIGNLKSTRALTQ